MQQKILILDPRRQGVETLRDILEKHGYETTAAFTIQEARSRLLERVFHLVLADASFVSQKQQNFLDLLAEGFPGLPCLVLEDAGSAEGASDAPGVFRFSRSLGLPALLDAIGDILNRVEADAPPPGEAKETAAGQLLGASAAMTALRETLQAVAETNATVLLCGETGTGKELAARFLHAHSRRSGQRFVAVNCAALTETLLESELFGHEKGAFTGAHRQKLGKFEHAGAGTLFLDEIGEISPHLQAKLLRVLDDKEFERVGGNRTLKASCRIVAASNIDFAAALEQGRFREDLFYRLNVVTIDLPPLRARKEDIPLLAQHFLKLAAARHNKEVRDIAADAMAQLLDHAWPGNVRELENTIERAVILASGEKLRHFPLKRATAAAPVVSLEAMQETMTLKEFQQRVLTHYEKEYFDRLLRTHRGHVSRSAEAAAIDRKTFYRKLAQCGLDPKQYKKGKSTDFV